MPKRVVESTAAAIAGGSHLTIDTPEVSLANGDLWVKLSSKGELKEIYAAGEGRAPSPEPKPVEVKGRLSVSFENSTGRWHEKTNIFELASKKAKLTAFVWPLHPVLVLHYEIPKGPWKYTMSVPNATVTEKTAFGARAETTQMHRLLVSGVGITCREAESTSAKNGRLVLSGNAHRFTILVGIGTPEEIRRSFDDYPGYDKILAETRNYWHSWIRQARAIDGLDSRLAVMYERALLSIKTHFFNTGAMFAGADGWYKNMWVRDSTYTMIGMDLAGFHDEAKRSHLFWASGRRAPWGTGASEWQEGAILLMGAWVHYALTSDREFLDRLWPYVERWSSFYVRQVDRYRGMIPLVEEWICCVTGRVAWPNAEVHGGLIAAAKIAETLNKSGHALACRARARTLRESILRDAFDSKLQRYVPFSGAPSDTRVDSGMLKLSQLAVYDPDFAPVPPGHLSIESTIWWIKRHLEQSDHLISRFEGNPRGLGYPQGEWGVWTLNTAWLSEYYALLGETDLALQYLKAIVGKRGFDYEAEFWRLPEQWAINGDVIRTTHDMSWSYGEFIVALVTYAGAARRGENPIHTDADALARCRLILGMEGKTTREIEAAFFRKCVASPAVRARFLRAVNSR
jgi:hypothetical protein